MPRPSRADEIRMMTHPDDWPMGNVLPLKKLGFDKLGMLYCAYNEDVVKPRVYLGNLYEIGSRKTFDDIEREDYMDFEAVLDAGWVVD